MEITFLIGNGFDLGLGLYTKYTDFLNRRYLKISSESGSLVDRFRRMVSMDVGSWSDAEMAFAGLGFSSLGEDVESTFVEVEEDFHSRLNEYLLDEESRLVIPEKDRSAATTGFAKSILNLFLKLAEGPRGDYVKLILASSRHVVNFINFNYTSTLEKIIGDCHYGRELVSVRRDDTEKIVFSLGNIVHVHGDLKSGNTIFGVASSEQISDSVLRQASSSEGYFIKDRIDSQVGGNRGKLGLDLLRRSDVIVTFGLSFGESDIGWWEVILSLMNLNFRQSILMCPYKPNGLALQMQNSMLYERAMEWKRFGRSFTEGYRRDDFERVKKRVHVVLCGNHKAPDGVVEYCDPLCLKWIGRNWVNGYVDRDKEYVAKSANPVVVRAIASHNYKLKSK